MSATNDPDCSRRSFLQAAALASSALTTGAIHATSLLAAQSSPPSARRPVVIASANGLNAIDKAMEVLQAHGDPLDAVIQAVNIVEDDPTDHSVGLGGLPNEDGIVELDSSVMHGPKHKAGAVASLRNIRNPSKVARLVMERTDHVLIVGDGALRFAKAHGFKEEDLLTDEARAIWLKWKESHSTDDDWLPPGDPPTTQKADTRSRTPLTYGTINCCAVDANGDIAGVTTTSGLSFKIPGRVGDSPIIGAGLYVDNAVGAAGSTGRGEANLQNCSSFLVVELMRGGASPQDACLQAMQRIADHTEPRLRDKQNRPTFDLKLYAVAKDGRFGGASMWSGGKFALHDGTSARLEECASLYKKP